LFATANKMETTCGHEARDAQRAIIDCSSGMRWVCQKMVTESLGKWPNMGHFPVRYDRMAGVD